MYLFYSKAESHRSKNATPRLKRTWILRSGTYRLWKLRQTIYFLWISVLLSIKYGSWSVWILRTFLSFYDAEEALREVAGAGSTWLLCSGTYKIHEKFSEHGLKPFSDCIKAMDFSLYKGMKLIVYPKWCHYFFAAKISRLWTLT